MRGRGWIGSGLQCSARWRPVALEALLGSLELSASIPALTTSAIAAYVAWIGLGDETPYVVTNLAISPSLVLWSIAMGPVFGLAGDWFARAAGSARAAAPRDRRLFIRCMIVFPAIGIIPAWYPQILGNGKGIAQLAFSGETTVALAVVLLLIRVTIPLGSLAAGAAGGLMTPSIAIGALLAILTGQAWNAVWPDNPSGAFAVVGAAAFLASSTKMPLTAVALLMEFTRIDHDFLIPMVLAVAGSVFLGDFAIREIGSRGCIRRIGVRTMQSFAPQVDPFRLKSWQSR